jgi:hypothetical protein
VPYNATGSLSHLPRTHPATSLLAPLISALDTPASGLVRAMEERDTRIPSLEQQLTRSHQDADAHTNRCSALEHQSTALEHSCGLLQRKCVTLEAKCCDARGLAPGAGTGRTVLARMCAEKDVRVAELERALADGRSREESQRLEIGSRPMGRAR